MKKEIKTVEFRLEDKVIHLETGRLALQADGAVLVSCGESQVLVTVVSEKEESKMDFFPLTVEYSEKFYSIGRFPGGYFKREGRPTNEAILNCRLIDRPLRPCFPEEYKHETQIVATILSYDKSLPVNSLASIGASAALHISDIPFDGPVGALQVARLNGKLTLNPSFEDLSKSDMAIFMAAQSKGILMVEGHAHFIPESDLLEALKYGENSIRVILEAQDELREKTGNKEKRSFLSPPVLNSLFSNEVRNFLDPKVSEALGVKEKKRRSEALSSIKEQVKKDFLNIQTVEANEHGYFENISKMSFEARAEYLSLKENEVNRIYEEVKYNRARKMILDEGKRIDGRGSRDIRPIGCEVGFLPRSHGSGLFTRGETQVLSTVTLGTLDDEQQVDSLNGVLKKQFLLHYNFPPFSVGEVGRLGGQSRREIGHGFLAENALKAIVPTQETFPYIIRIVSEVLESNGSSSMGTICSGVLALLDAGVPVRENIAGIAMGLIKEENKVQILSDILGDEDHLGDMDFKVAGSRSGITALQMDIKITGISFDLLEKALKQANEGRLHILDEMEKVKKTPNKDISQYAPRITSFRVKTSKIRDIIGTGGKVIREIIEKTGVKMSVEDDGMVQISSSDSNSIKQAVKMVEDICAEAEVGKTYNGKITKITDFGAFVELLPNTSGLLHISEISHKRIRRVTDVLKEGENVSVKVLDIDRSGKIRLSRKALISKI